MTVAVVASVIGLLAVVVALLLDRPLGEPLPAGPRWTGPPPPEQLTRVTFPLAFRGYDPAHVEAHLDAVRRAYEQLLAAARPQLEDLGSGWADAGAVGPDPMRPTPVSTPDGEPRVPALVGTRPESDREALRTAAALFRLERSRTDVPAASDAVRAPGLHGGHGGHGGHGSHGSRAGHGQEPPPGSRRAPA